MYSKILTFLNTHTVPYTLHEHPPLRTVADLEANLQLPSTHFVKTVAFRIKDGDYVLAATRGRDRVDYKKVAQYFGVSRRRLRALSPEELEAELGVPMGGVAPFGLWEDVTILVDEAVEVLGQVYCGSGKITVTLGLKSADLLRLPKSELLKIIKD